MEGDLRRINSGNFKLLQGYLVDSNYLDIPFNGYRCINRGMDRKTSIKSKFPHIIQPLRIIYLSTYCLFEFFFHNSFFAFFKNP